MTRDGAIDGTIRHPARGWFRLVPLLVAIAAVVSFVAHDGLMAASAATPGTGSPTAWDHHAHAEPVGHGHPEGCSTTREAAPTQRIDDVVPYAADSRVTLLVPVALGASLAFEAASASEGRRPRRSDLQVWRV